MKRIPWTDDPIAGDRVGRGITAETLIVVAAFVLFFVLLDLSSTLLVIDHYGSWITAFEVNVFLHLAGVNGLATMKIGLMILALGAIVVFTRYQLIIDEVLIGLATAGAICGASNLYLLQCGDFPGIGAVDAVHLAGVAIGISLMKAALDAGLSRLFYGRSG